MEMESTLLLSHLVLSVLYIHPRWLSDYVEELLERAEQYKMNHGVDMETDIETPYLRKTQLAEKLKKRHEDKHQWFLNVKKRKLLEKQEQESKSTDEKTEKL